jgi:hypothetical protein
LLRKTQNQANRTLIIKKLEDIDKQKKSFKWKELENIHIYQKKKLR